MVSSPFHDSRGRMTDAAYHLARFWISEGCSVAEIGRRLRVARKTVTDALSRLPPSQRPARIPRPSLAANHLSRRRAKVRRLALTVRWCHRAQSNMRTYGSARAISRALPEALKASVTTIARDLKLMGFVSRRRPKGPVNSQNDHVNRVAACKANLLLPQKKYFSDEKMFDVNDHGAGREWCLPGVSPSRRQYARWCPTVHVWGVIGVGFKKLIVLPKGTIDAAKYVRLCLAKVVPELRKGVFMQDGAPCHTAQSTMAYLARMGVTVMAWSARSCDLNPIEQLWALIQREVSRRGPVDRDELVRFVVEEWEKYPQAVIDKLVLSFEKKARACVASGGATVWC